MTRQFKTTPPPQCGILAIFDSSLKQEKLRKQALECSKILRHRGPDWNGIVIDGQHAIAHERLAIVDPESGEQPLISNCGDIVLSVNGEIYNHKQLKTELKNDYTFKTQSDCEVIIPLYQELGPDFVKKLTGMFSFVLYDKKKDQYFAYRDHMGITPLYMGYGSDGAVMFSSELKGLINVCGEFKTFPPGHMYSSATGELTPWYTPDWADGRVPNTPLDLEAVRNEFIAAVERRTLSPSLTSPSLPSLGFV
jgi:asparagine synthase (glutamine-hydrolysing)